MKLDIRLLAVTTGAVLLLAFICGEPSNAEPLALDERYGVELLAQGEIPAGASSFNRFWMYRGMAIEELIDDLVADLTRDGWHPRVVDVDDPVSGGSLYVRDASETRCVAIFDPRSDAGGSRSFRMFLPDEALLQLEEDPDPVIAVEALKCI